MTIASFIGMTHRFISCTLAQQYQTEESDGSISGGPMVYLPDGLKAMGLPRLGQWLGNSYALIAIVASFGSGNMFQANQSCAALASLFPNLQAYDWLYGLGLMALVGAVVLGGLQRIAAVTSRLVPTMLGLYLLACLWVILAKWPAVPGAIATIVEQAFFPTSVELSIEVM